MKTDYEIKKDVIDELGWDPLLKNSSEIGVAVHDGIVTLGGYVDFYSEKLAAEKAAKRIKGVKAVAMDIDVRLTDDGKLPDAKVAESVVRALEWNALIPEEHIQIKVDNGWVYLDGEVDWLYQKEMAEKVIADLSGIRGISNNIIVKPELDTIIVKENIKKALERAANLEADNIKIETTGHKVILRGVTRSWTEKKAVEKAVASAPGVAEVDDQLDVVYDTI